MIVKGINVGASKKEQKRQRIEKRLQFAKSKDEFNAALKDMERLGYRLVDGRVK